MGSVHTRLCLASFSGQKIKFVTVSDGDDAAEMYRNTSLTQMLTGNE